MHRLSECIMLGLLLLGICSSTLFGQTEVNTIHLRDGTIIQGRILAQDDSTLVVETQYGTLEIRRTSILREELAKQLPTTPKPKEAQTVYLKDGTTVKGVITFESADSLTVETGYGSMKIPKSSVYHVGSKPTPQREGVPPVRPQRDTGVLRTPARENNSYLYFSGGMSFPLKPDAFSDHWEMGFNIGAGFGFEIAPPLSLLALVDYNYLPFNKDQFLKDLGFSGSNVSVSGHATSILTVTGGIKILVTPSSSEPEVYLLGGIGFFRVSISKGTTLYQGRTGTLCERNESAFSAHFGAGVDVPVGEVTYIFLQASYGIGFTKVEATNYMPLKFGVRFKV
jgi:opacity protein-like surface antigen